MAAEDGPSGRGRGRRRKRRRRKRSREREGAMRGREKGIRKKIGAWIQKRKRWIRALRGRARSEKRRRGRARGKRFRGKGRVESHCI